MTNVKTQSESLTLDKVLSKPLDNFYPSTYSIDIIII